MNLENPTIVFLCTHNACRSQIAEGLMRELYADKVNVYSAGSTPVKEVNKFAILIMKERGIDISKHHPKHMDDINVEIVDLTVTLCANNGDVCPSFTNKIVKKHLHHEFDDPSQKPMTEEVGLSEFRRVRDEIEAFLRKLYPSLLL
jgi:arsenate reductase